MRHIALPRRHGNDILPHARAPSDIAPSTSSGGSGGGDGGGGGGGGGDSIRGSSCSRLPLPARKLSGASERASDASDTSENA